MSVASLPMYDFIEVRPSTMALMAAITAEFATAGWPTAITSSPSMTTHRQLTEHWLDPDLAFSQACGLPLIESLQDHVTVLGTFRHRTVSDRGRYRARLIGRTADAWRDGARPAINGWESLSGWASLGVVAADDGIRLGPPMVTGAHANSLAALQRGEADVASIDATTLALFTRHRGAAVEGLHIIGSGPEVPALPIICAAEGSVRADRLRDALRAAVDRPDLAADLDRLMIDGFVALDLEDYRPIEALIEAAERGLPRPF